jgi:hypothetical protein
MVSSDPIGCCFPLVAVFIGVPSGYYDYHVTAVIVAYCGTQVSSGQGVHRSVTSGNTKLTDYS